MNVEEEGKARTVAGGEALERAKPKIGLRRCYSANGNRGVNYLARRCEGVRTSLAPAHRTTRGQPHDSLIAAVSHASLTPPLTRVITISYVCIYIFFPFCSVRHFFLFNSCSLVVVSLFREVKSDSGMTL